MKHSIHCPNCEEELILGEDLIGLNIRCTECGHDFKMTLARETQAVGFKCESLKLIMHINVNSH